MGKNRIKNIFDWLQHITLYKTPASEFTDNDWENFNSYMVHRFVSMSPYYVEVADYAQSMLPTMKKEIYNFYKEMLPKKKVWLQYIKSKTKDINRDLVEEMIPKRKIWLQYIKTKNKQVNKELVEKIAEYYEVGTSDARSYINVITDEEMPTILGEMGLDKKEIKKLLK